MGISNLGQTGQKTRDEIGGPSSATYPAIVIFKEDIIVEENSTVHQELDVSNNFVLGHSSYGILDTSQLNGAPTPVTIRVTNPNEEYKEYIYMDFMFSSASTATINTTTQVITF